MPQVSGAASADRTEKVLLNLTAGSAGGGAALLWHPTLLLRLGLSSK